MSERVWARYWIETAFPLEVAAATMASEQSTGTFARVPGETEELRESYGARVESIEEGEPAASPTLAGAGRPKGVDGRYRRVEVTLSWPLENMGPSRARAGCAASAVAR